MCIQKWTFFAFLYDMGSLEELNILNEVGHFGAGLRIADSIFSVIPKAFDGPNTFGESGQIFHNRIDFLFIGGFPCAELAADDLIGGFYVNGVETSGGIRPPVLPIIHAPAQNFLRTPGEI